MCEIKVGDIVRTRRSFSSFERDWEKGSLGKVVKIKKNLPFPYYILLNRGHAPMPCLKSEIMKNVTFQVGDKVRLNSEGLKSEVLIPADLVKSGVLVNEFTVVKINNYYISLKECCEGIGTCTAHPAEYFELIYDDDKWVQTIKR